MKIISAHTTSTDLILRTLKKYSSRDISAFCSFLDPTFLITYNTSFVCELPYIQYVLVCRCPVGPLYLNPIILYRRKIRLIEGNAKCRHLKKGSSIPFPILSVLPDVLYVNSLLLSFYFPNYLNSLIS